MNVTLTFDAMPNRQFITAENALFSFELETIDSDIFVSVYDELTEVCWKPSTLPEAIELFSMLCIADNVWLTVLATILSGTPHSYEWFDYREWFDYQDYDYDDELFDEDDLLW